MRNIAIVDENGIIQNIIVVADGVPAEKFGGKELYKEQAIGDVYYIPESEPTAEEQLTDLQAMAVDYEYRLTLLELGVN